MINQHFCVRTNTICIILRLFVYLFVFKSTMHKARSRRPCANGTRSEWLYDFACPTPLVSILTPFSTKSSRPENYLEMPNRSDTDKAQTATGWANEAGSGDAWFRRRSRNPQVACPSVEHSIAVGRQPSPMTIAGIRQSLSIDFWPNCCQYINRYSLLCCPHFSVDKKQCMPIIRNPVTV